MNRQDRQGVRTPADLERKYNYGRVFEEISGIQLSIEEQNALVKAELSLKLGYDDKDKIVSMLNASADIITIKGNRLTIESDNFSLDEDGTITATAGVIGGCTIKDGVLQIKAINIVDQLTADQIDTQVFDERVSEVETSLSIVSGQIESKVEQTDFDALGKTVSSHETRITQTEKDISLKVSQDDFNELGQRVTDAESEISIAQGQIALKVSQTDFDTLSGTVNTHETRITQTEKDITLKVSSTEFNELGERVSTVEGDLSLKIGRDESDQIVSMLNASADVISISSERFKLTGDNIHWVDGNLQTAKIYAGDSTQYNMFAASNDGVSIGENIILRNVDPDGTTVYKGILECDDVLLKAYKTGGGGFDGSLIAKIQSLEERIAHLGG